MKKITAFFMAILPFLVVIILFATGLIVKDAKHVYVKAIECIDSSLSIQQTTDSPEEFDVRKNVNIIPAIASNPELFYTSDDPEIVKVDYTSGKATTTGFGSTKINIKSQENPSIQATCKVTVWDDKVHKIIIDNKTNTSFVPCNTSVVLQTRTIPSITGEKLSYEVETGSEALVSVDKDGKITTGTTPGEATIIISSSNKSVTYKHKIYIGDLVESIYFDNPATTIISDTKYDLSKHIHTAPFDVMTQDINVSEYFDFTTSDYMSAEIDANGLITFKKQTDSNKIPVFSASLKGTTVSASKSIASTLEYLIDVSFNKYNYTTTLTSSNINKPINASEFNWSVYPSATATTIPVELASSNPGVVELVDNQFVIKGAGQTTLSATIHTSDKTTKTDRCFVTILDPNTTILSKDKLTVSDSYNCYLGQYVNKQYLNQDVKWKVVAGSDIATVNNSGVVTFNQKGTAKIQAIVGTTTSTIEVECTFTGVKEIDITDTTQTYVAKAGEKVKFKVGDNYVKPSFDEEQSKKVTKIDETTYILNAGSEEVWEVAFEDADSIYFVIQEDAIGVSPIQPGLWPYYVTNASIVNVSSLVSSYPSTATNAEGEKIYPNYEIKLEEGSISTVIGALITFAKPEYADIKVTLNDQTYEYGIKSQFGLFGKFSLKDDESKTIQSGETYTLDSGVTKTFEITDLLINDLPSEPTKEEMEERFRIQSLNEGTIVKDLKTTYDVQNKKLTFSFTTNTIGSDVILISNDTFNFVINVNVTDKIHSFNLFNSDGTQLSSTSTLQAPINSYSKDLNLFVSTNPAGAKSENITVTWNDQEISFNNSFIDLNGKEWKTGANKLTLTAKDTGATSTYYLQYKDTIPGFTIQQSVVEQSKNLVYVQAGTTLANMTIKISDGLASPSFFSNNFKYTVDGKESQTESNQINIPLPEPTNESPGCEKEVTVTYTSGSITSKYTISRDIVSKIELPNHNNAEEDDKKGMQKVHVFGNKSYYDDVEKEIDGYRLPIEIYDYKGNLVEDVVQKEQLFNSLVTTFDKNGGSVVYEQGHLRVKFDSNSLYTPEEIFNDAFVEGSKSQKINVATHWGLYNLANPKGKDVNVGYSFVAVAGVNCYVQEAIIANNGQNKNIVLQTNFGMEGLTKENQPFDKALQWSECNALYGNGYGINFDAATTSEQHPMFAFYLINARLFGCNDEKLKQQNDKKCFFKQFYQSAFKVKYCIFENWYQAIMYSSPGDYQNYLFNSVFYNNKGNCFSVNGATCYVQNCGFFKCSSIALTVSKEAKVYLKGIVDIYNFVNDEIFKDIQGHDLSFLWPIAEPLLKEANMLQAGPDGRQYVNAYCLSLLENHFFFYTGKDDQGKDKYEESEQGSSLAANHLAKGVNIDVPFVGNVTIWTTRNPQTETGAPSYYDEFDAQGNVRTNKLQELIFKLSRQI